MNVGNRGTESFGARDVPVVAAAGLLKAVPH
jgi:hypothetical protein